MLTQMDVMVNQIEIENGIKKVEMNQKEMR